MPPLCDLEDLIRKLLAREHLSVECTGDRVEHGLDIGELEPQYFRKEGFMYWSSVLWEAQ